MFAYEALEQNVPRGSKIISMLPMAHTYGMSFEFIFEIMQGCHVYYLTRVPSPKVIFKAFAEIKPDIVIAIDSRKGVLTGEVKNDSVKIDALELSLTDLDYEGKLGKWASRIPEKAKVTFAADEKAKFDDVQKTMDALSTAGVKFRMSAKE